MNQQAQEFKRCIRVELKTGFMQTRYNNKALQLNLKNGWKRLDLKQHLFSDFVNLYFHPRIFISLEETEDDQLDYRDFQKILGKGNEDLIDDIIQLVVADQFFQ